jgi:general secretion pathway protein K
MLGAVTAALRTLGADDGAVKGGAPAATPAVTAAPSLPPGLRPVRAAELAALPGATPRDVARVLPYLVALPSTTPLNVNTATPEVLAAALPGLRSDALAALVATRAQKPFATLSDLRARMPGEVRMPDESTLGTSSSYFLVSVRARQGETRAQARALLRRDGREWPLVVWQTLE